MKQHSGTVVKQEDAAKFEKWCFQQTVELEHTRKELENTRRDMEEQQRDMQQKIRDLERQKRQFEYERDLEMDRIKREQHLFDMKWKILESELEKLAAEKQQVEKRKAFYSRVNDYERSRTSSSNVVKGELFFMGVGNEQSLRKRYKDLIKIYHPDNLDGDTGTIQEINREYNALKKKLEISS